MIQYYDKKEESNAKAIEYFFDETQRLDGLRNSIHDFFDNRSYIFAGFNKKRVDVFKKYFGLGCKPMSLGEIAKEYDCTKENARIKIRMLLSNFKNDPYHTVMLNYTDDDLKGRAIETNEDIQELYNQLGERRKYEEYEYYKSVGKQDFEIYTTLQKVLDKPCCEVGCFRDIYSVDYEDGNIGSILNSENKNLSDKVAIRMLLHSRGLVFKDECRYGELWTEGCIEGIKQYGIEKFKEDFEISGKSLFNKIISRPISTLGLNLMGQLVLTSDGIETIKDLITKTPRYIKLLRHMGDITYNDIKEKIISLGLGFRPMGMPEQLWLDKLEHRFDLGINNKPENINDLLEFTNCDDINNVYLFEIIDGDDFPSFFERECRKANIVKVSDIINCTQKEVDELIKSCGVLAENKYTDKIDNILHKFGIELQGYSRTSNKDLVKLKADELQKSFEKERQCTDVNDYLLYFDKILNIDISELGLELMTYNSLARHGFRTVKDVVSRKKDDIINIPQFGKKRYFDVMEMLSNIEETFGVTLTLNDTGKHPKTHLQNLRSKNIAKIKLKVDHEKKNLEFGENVKMQDIPEEIRGLFAENIGNKIKDEMSHTNLSKRLKERIIAKQNTTKPRVLNNPYRENRTQKVWNSNSMSALSATDPEVLIALLKENRKVCIEKLHYNPNVLIAQLEKNKVINEEQQFKIFELITRLFDILPNSDDLDM